MNLPRIVSCFAVATAVTAPSALAQQPTPADALKSEMLPLFEFLMAKCAAFGWGLIALGVFAILVVGFFAAWGVSKLLTPDTGTLPNALRYYLCGMLATGVLIGITFGVGWFAISNGKFGLALGMLALVSLVGLIINFAIPMKIYQIGFIRAFFFNLLVGLAAGLGQGVLGAFLPGPFDDFRDKSPEEQRKIVSQWRLEKGERELTAQAHQQAVPGPSAATLSGIQRVQQMHDQLQAERAKLDVNDQAAVTAFNEHVAEYNAFKAQVAATLPATPAPAKASQVSLPAK